MIVSISKEFEDYDYAVFNGKRTLNLSAGARSLTLKPGDTFGYRSARNSVYLVMPERGLTYEYKITEDDFDRRIAPKADEVKPAKAKKLFTAKPEKEPIRPKRTGSKVEPVAPPMEPKKAAPPPPRPTLTLDLPPPEKPKVDPNMDQEQHELVKLYGNPTRFARIRTSAEAIGYMIEVWNKVNTTKCDNKLVRPTFLLTKDMKASTRRMGYWSPGRRVLGASPRLFKAKEHIALTTIIHEIAHEAVTDIEQMPAEGNGGHGPVWSKWMRKFGLTPSRYTQYDAMEYFDDNEKKEIQRRQDDVRSQIDDLKANHAKQTEHNILPGYSRPAQFYHVIEKKWVKGMIAAPLDKAMSKWAFVRPGYTDKYDIVPNNRFYAVPKETFSPDQIEQMKRISEKVVQHVERKSAIRSAKRAMRRGGY